jgi:hypothetical protein
MRSRDHSRIIEEIDLHEDPMQQTFNPKISPEKDESFYEDIDVSIASLKPQVEESKVEKNS